MHTVGQGLLQHALNVNHISEVSKRQASQPPSQPAGALLYLQRHRVIDSACNRKKRGEKAKQPCLHHCLKIWKLVPCSFVDTVKYQMALEKNKKPS